MNPTATRTRTHMRVASLIIMLMTLFLATGCGLLKKPEITGKTSLERLRITQYPQFDDSLDYSGLIDGIDGSLEYLNRVPETREFYVGRDIYTAAHLKKSLQHFRDRLADSPGRETLNRFIRDDYIVYQSVGRDGRGEMLFTGYYEPTIAGSLTKLPEYPYPVYARPKDLTTIDLSLFGDEFKGKQIVGRYTGESVVPYYRRSEIDHTGILDDRCDILAWVRDPVDLFFLQIQGSGKIMLAQGGHLNVHYHVVNGHPYRSIGRMLIDEGKITKEEMSMQKIRSYLKEHPGEVDRVLNYNPSYVFFKLEEEGPVGFLQVKLTPVRSIALDRRLFPPAALAFIETERPELDHYGEIFEWRDLKAFVLNQDTGGAIRGPGRADLFWGNGHYAEVAAGYMQHPGRLYFLVLKPDIE